MYGAVWRSLPGPWWFKAIIAIILIAIVVFACFQWLFPWVSEYVPWLNGDVSVG